MDGGWGADAEGVCILRALLVGGTFCGGCGISLSPCQAVDLLGYCVLDHPLLQVLPN